MSDKNHGAAFTDSHAPRAFQLVTRKGVVTSQLRGSGGRFGGRAPAQALPTLEDAIAAAEHEAFPLYTPPSSRPRLSRFIAIACVVLAIAAVLYFAGQFLR